MGSLSGRAGTVISGSLSILEKDKDCVPPSLLLSNKIASKYLTLSFLNCFI